LERLLVQSEDQPLASTTLRLLRAIELLEGLATDHAKAVLQALASGSTLAWGTKEAREALERLGQK
jgi:hypothetical protein